MASSALDLDSLCQLLADAERRRIVRLLARLDPPLTLRDIAVQLVSELHGQPVADIPAVHLGRVSAQLHHVHLPKLAQAGVIAYDPDRQWIDEMQLDELVNLLDAVTGVIAD